MPKKDFTFTSKILLWCLAAADVAETYSYSNLRKGLPLQRKNTMDVTLHRLYKKGWIKFVDKEGERFLKLTKKGQIEALMAKARIPLSQKWDGKWRIIFFDIPESAREKRYLLRLLLKQNGFKKLQASAYASPYPLNRNAIAYLHETKLHNFIRIIKAEEIDDDKDLRKLFGLKN